MNDAIELWSIRSNEHNARKQRGYTLGRWERSTTLLSYSTYTMHPPRPKPYWYTLRLMQRLCILWKSSELRHLVPARNVNTSALLTPTRAITGGGLTGSERFRTTLPPYLSSRRRIFRSLLLSGMEVSRPSPSFSLLAASAASLPKREAGSQRPPRSHSTGVRH